MSISTKVLVHPHKHPSFPKTSHCTYRELSIFQATHHENRIPQYIHIHRHCRFRPVFHLHTKLSRYTAFYHHGFHISFVHILLFLQKCLQWKQKEHSKLHLTRQLSLGKRTHWRSPSLFDNLVTLLLQKEMTLLEAFFLFVRLATYKLKPRAPIRGYISFAFPPKFERISKASTCTACLYVNTFHRQQSERLALWTWERCNKSQLQRWRCEREIAQATVLESVY